ncbi:hypothetical protein BASA61_004098 [Batrachochytrium salamandrivorans]|nr:hypothetical protein BASA62_007577 [Batrachochytrium salamandrivorans]KAH6594109.1 hypothetical protein BASA61_004098 [Batrachochytrium salamandrivorans]
MTDTAATGAGTEPNLIKDDVTGEMVSKSELKRRVKQRSKDAIKAEKAAAAPPPKAKKTDENGRRCCTRGRDGSSYVF